VAERLLTNGRIYTLGRQAAWAEALLARDGRVVAVGEAAAARAAAGPDPEVLDLGGRLVLPGLIDPHNHLLSTAESMTAVDLRYPGVKSLEDLLVRVAERAEQLPPEAWVRGFGMNHPKYPEGQPPTRWNLDLVSGDHPVVIYHSSGHHAVVNSAALRLRGVSDDVADPKGGHFVRDERGRPTGFLLDAATNVVLPAAVDVGNHGPNFHTDIPLQELVDDLAVGGRAYLQAGLTTICDPEVTRRELQAYQESRRRGQLPLRVACMPSSAMLDQLLEAGFVGDFGDDHLRLTGIKLYCDGALTGGTAAFSGGYGARGEFPGSFYHPPEELAALVLKAHAAGWRVGIHTQGDVAMGITLDAIEAALRAVDRPDPRPRIEHGGYPTAEHLERMRQLNVTPVSQPSHLRQYGDELIEWLGPRAQHLQPFREQLARGVRVVLSSDAFVASYRPLETIANALERATLGGREIGRAHALTLEEAIRAHTLDAAYAIGMEDRVGSLEPGKWADYVVLDTDLFRASVDEIRAARPLLTAVGGLGEWRAAGTAL
jgi:predicted amidohydrolase YtcJ